MRSWTTPAHRRFPRSSSAHWFSSGPEKTARPGDFTVVQLLADALAGVSPDPAAARRRDDRAVVHGLAALEQRGMGLRVPARPPD